MKFYSTNNKNLIVDLRRAVTEGLAPDNGLYMPFDIPRLPEVFFKDIAKRSFKDIGSEGHYQETPPLPTSGSHQMYQKPQVQ